MIIKCNFLSPAQNVIFPQNSFRSQIGNESSIDRLMKQISTFMSEISDEFKIVVVDAIRFVYYPNLFLNACKEE